MEWQAQCRHTRGNESRRFSFPFTPGLPHALLSMTLALATMTLLGLGHAAPCHGGLWPFAYDDAYEKSRDEFKAVHESVSTTKDEVEAAKQVVDAVAGDIDSEIKRLKKAGMPISDKLKNAATRIKNAQKTLELSQELLTNFSDYSGKITAATDVYDEIVELRKKMAASYETLGPLGAEMQALGAIMQKGENIPILGKAIETYGTITTGLVNKLGEVATTIDKNRNQDLIGEGAYDTNEKARIFHEFRRSHPELVGLTYEPSSPSYLYAPEDEARGGPSVLWDEESKQFIVVPRDVPAKTIFQMQLLNDERLSASELVMHMDEWKKGGAKRLETAGAMHAFFNGLRKFDYSVVSQNSHEDLSRLLRNPRLFEARYVYDRRTHEQLHNDLKAIYDGLMAKGDEDSKKQAAQIRRFAKKYKLDIAFTAPVEPQNPEKKATGKEEPSAVDGFFRSLAEGLDKVGKELEKIDTKQSTPQRTATPQPQQQTTETKQVEEKPAVKAGGVVGSCGECIQSGLDCACGRAACRCCAPGDSNCNAYDL